MCVISSSLSLRLPGWQEITISCYFLVKFYPYQFSFVANLLSLIIIILKVKANDTQRTQHAKKVVSHSPGLVDFSIELVNSVFNLPDRQVMFFEEFE